MNPTLLEAIKKSAAVPSMPQVVARFLEIMQDPEFSYGDLVKALSVDPGTVSEVLRLANSALFGVRHKIISLKQALTLLGPKRTRSLILGRYLVDAVSKQSSTALDMSYFWRRSLATAVVTSRLAERLIPRHRDEAFIAALLADIGVPILAEAMEQQYKPIVCRYAPQAEPITPAQEMDAVQGTHSEVSSLVLAHWGLPQMVVDAVRLQDSSDPGEGVEADIARVLMASERIAMLLCEVTGAEEIVAKCTCALQFVHLDLSVIIELLPTIETDVEELATVLRIDVVPSHVYQLIAKTIEDALNAPAT